MKEVSKAESMAVITVPAIHLPDSIPFAFLVSTEGKDTRQGDEDDGQREGEQVVIHQSASLHPPRGLAK